MLITVQVFSNEVVVSIARSPIEFPELIREGDHLVQFYKSETYLAESVANYVAPSLMNGEGVLIVATREHLDLFDTSLRELFINTSFLKLTKQLVMLDAKEVLGEVSRNGTPDPDLFKDYFRKVLTELKAQYGIVKTYEGMVNLLWNQGDLEGTLAAEELWDELIKDLGTTLLCSYSMESLSEEKHGVAFSEICLRHTHVIPAEGIIESNDHRDQLKKIAELQFKISSKNKIFNELKVNTLEMMIPLMALKIHLRELKQQIESIDGRSMILKCEHQIERMASITEKLSR